MEKKFHPLRAIIIIVILSLLIILPPLFRLLFPKIEQAVPKNQNKVTSLICKKEYPAEQMTALVEVRYINAKINQTKITYTYNESTRTVENMITQEPITTAKEQMDYFRNIKGISINENPNKTIFIINQDTINQNQDNKELKENYFNDKKTTQKIFFVNQYYSCEETTN